MQISESKLQHMAQNSITNVTLLLLLLLMLLLIIVQQIISSELLISRIPGLHYGFFCFSFFLVFS